MKKSLFYHPRSHSRSDSKLDTLAQPVTEPHQEDEFSLQSSTLKSDKTKLSKRARAKYLSQALAVQLAELRTNLEKSYRNTVYCSSILKQEGDHVHGTYCKNRWCMVCNRIRTAKLIRDYQPVLDSQPDKYFVTLTLPNVSAGDLRSTIAKMQAQFKLIMALFKMRASRSGSFSTFSGFRKLECTYNPDRNDFHPHYHVVVFGRQNAIDLLQEWLRRFPAATTDAQDVRPADDSSTKELFKYFTKVISKPKGAKDGTIYLSALDVIFTAIKGFRIFQPFGKFKPLAKELPELTEEAIQEQLDEVDKDMKESLWSWSQLMHDWVNFETGELLTGYEPTPQFQKLVDTVRGVYDPSGGSGGHYIT